MKRAGGAVIAFFFGLLSSLNATEALAEDDGRCTAFRNAGKGFEKLELRVCKAEGKEPNEVAFEIEARSTYENELKARVDVGLGDSTVEKVDAKIPNGTSTIGACKSCKALDDIKTLRAAIVDTDAAAATPEALHKVAGNRTMEVLARDLRLTDTNAERLKRIAARYFKATKKRLVVTGGTRSAQRQAQLVYDKLKHGDDIVALYENKAAATELRNAYRDAEAKGLKRKATIKAMTDMIEAQIGRGIYVSKHLKSGAVDVRSWDMEEPAEKALKEAVKEEAGVTLMDERKGPEPHFHLNMQ